MVDVAVAMSVCLGGNRCHWLEAYPLAAAWSAGGIQSFVVSARLAERPRQFVPNLPYRTVLSYDTYERYELLSSLGTILFVSEREERVKKMLARRPC